MVICREVKTSVQLVPLTHEKLDALLLRVNTIYPLRWDCLLFAPKQIVACFGEQIHEHCRRHPVMPHVRHLDDVSG